jgi:hypothetical protein
MGWEDLDFVIDADDARPWRDAGFSPSEASAWTAEGVADVDEAIEERSKRARSHAAVAVARQRHGTTGA